MRLPCLALCGVVLIAFLPAPVQALTIAPTCSDFGGPSWNRASASCTFLCLKPGVAEVWVVGGGFAGTFVAGSGCGALCAFRVACGGISPNPIGPASQATCSGSARSLFSMVNVGVACWSAGASTVSGNAITVTPLKYLDGVKYRIDMPTFDPALVEAGDEICMPSADLEGATEMCLPIREDGLAMFVGHESFLPFGIYCEASDCVETNWAS